MYVVERKIDNSHVTRKGKWHNVYPGVQYETREQALAHKPDNAREKSSYMTITYNYRVAKKKGAY